MFKRVVFLGVLVALVSLPTAAGAAAIGDSLAALPVPGAYPTGLAFRGAELWTADWETGSLYQLDPVDGRVVRELDGPCFHPMGLASDGKMLFVSDYETARIYVFDPETGLTMASYEGPEGSPRGLAYGGGSLWLVDDGEDTIYEMVPADGTILNYYKAPQGGCLGLAHDGTYLWVSDRVQNELYAVRPTDGRVIFLVKAPAPYPHDLAFGQGSIWVADFETKLIYRLGMRADTPYSVTNEITRDFRFQHALRNDGEGVITEAVINIACPYDSLENQRILGGVRWSREPDEFVVDRWGQKCAVFRYRDVPAHARVAAGYEARVRLGELHYAFFPEKLGGLNKIPADIRKTFTAPTSRLQMDRVEIQKTAKEIVGDEKNPYWIARKIFDWVNDKLEYKRVGGWDVPTTLIKRGTGSCSEYAFLYIALCRSVGLPARYEASVVVRGDDASFDDVYHRWCEVYLPGIGWMPVDPSGGDREWPADQARYFGGLANRFMITTHGGGDSEQLGWDYNAHAGYTYEGRGQVREEGYGIWSAVKNQTAP
jgi:hypothetical protein